MSGRMLPARGISAPQNAIKSARAGAANRPQAHNPNPWAAYAAYPMTKGAPPLTAYLHLLNYPVNRSPIILVNS